ncbi:MAG: chemotaxis protein CheA [Deltaproteobacteria bacterium]|nr:chemotaxis protein CheA [Deltaproteobacteria bacterium]
MTPDDVLKTFITESRELLEVMETDLLGLERSGAPEETLNAIFRAAHTVKGSAGMFGLDHLVHFAHAVEGVLDAFRGQQLAVTPDRVSLLLRCKDHLSALLDEVAKGQLVPSPALAALTQPLALELGAQLGGPASLNPEPTAAPSGAWHVSVRFQPGVLRQGLDPIAFVRHLGTVGELLGVSVVEGPRTEDPTDCRLGFELALRGPADEAVINEAFGLVKDQCRLWILPPGSPTSAFLRMIDLLPEGPQVLDPLIAATGSVELSALQKARQASAAEDVRTVFLFEDLEAEAKAATATSSPPPQSPTNPSATSASRTANTTEAGSKEGRTLRVDADKLDHLIDLVGELIIAAAGGQVMARRASVPELEEVNSTIAELVEEVRDSALQLRMIKIGGTFARFQRVVRDVARDLGKDIVLEVSGEETELDKTVVEKLGDPLMHLVRNAMDHGIESSERRLAAGKPVRGTVGLNAFHESGNIVIEVKDDGGGLDRDRIMKKAIDRGLIEAHESLSDEQIFRLIFEPGFSTAAEVTNISGRGVGMDVVKRNVEAMRGSVHVRSQPGQGTTVSVRLPLTLAIIDGFLVGVGPTSYVVPLETVEECVELKSEGEAHYTNLRGEVLPFIRLREVFGLPANPNRRESVVVLRHGNLRAGLVVDTLLGEFQTVIKPLNAVFNRARCISGSTILGTGEVGLILDVAVLIKDSMQRAREHEDHPGTRSPVAPASVAS